MENKNKLRSRELLVGLRKITQAIDLHSKHLLKIAGITSPQLVILQELAECDSMTTSEVAKAVSLTQGTVTTIIVRLEKNDLVNRRRSGQDKRRIYISITEKGKQLLADSPSPLQEKFANSYYKLEEWEQLMILTSINRIVSMMSAEKIEASPFLVSGPLENNS